MSGANTWSGSGNNFTGAVNVGANLTVGPPSSGAALTLTGVSGSPALLVNSAAGIEAVQVVGASGNNAVINLVDGNTGNATWGLASGYPSTGDFSVFLSGVGAKLSIGTTGNTFISTPTSGNTLTVYGVAGGTAIVAEGSTTAGGSNGLFISAGTNTTDAALVVNNATNTAPYFKIRGDGEISALGPTNAGLVDMTPDNGAFTGTPTGVSAGGPYICYWYRIGKQVTLSITNSNSTCTSNATTFTITGLPSNLQPVSLTNQNMVVAATMLNGGATAANASAQITTGSGTISLAVGGNFGGWTNSSTKGVPSGFSFTFTYLLS